MNLGYLDDLTTAIYIYGGVVGQSIFWLLYLTRPWLKYRPTRAFMMHNTAMLMIFIVSTTRYTNAGGIPIHNEDTSLILFSVFMRVFILFTIWYQLASLIIEMWKQWTGCCNDDPKYLPPREKSSA